MVIMENTSNRLDFFFKQQNLLTSQAFNYQFYRFEITQVSIIQHDQLSISFSTYLSLMAFFNNIIRRRKIALPNYQNVLKWLVQLEMKPICPN
jgi:hypothetical protein